MPRFAWSSSPGFHRLSTRSSWSVTEPISLPGKAAESFGARLVELPRRLGPAHARNHGAFAATGDVLLFVDADVLVPSDVVHEILQVLDVESGVAACFGSYDDAPAETNFLSQYKNLFHHYVHQNSPAEASTFWTGCGAIFRHVFQEPRGIQCDLRSSLGGRHRVWVSAAGCRLSDQADTQPPGQTSQTLGGQVAPAHGFSPPCDSLGPAGSKAQLDSKRIESITLRPFEWLCSSGAGGILLAASPPLAGRPGDGSCGCGLPHSSQPPSLPVLQAKARAALHVGCGSLELVLLPVRQSRFWSRTGAAFACPVEAPGETQRQKRANRS